MQLFDVDNIQKGYSSRLLSYFCIERFCFCAVRVYNRCCGDRHAEALK